MTIGIPRALLYYRYGRMWKTFFEQLGLRVLISGESDQRIFSQGERLTESECCLPVKIFIGHIASLVGRCDLVFVPRIERLAENDEFCVRFWGLPDIARATFPGLRVLSYNLRGGLTGNELSCFLRLGRILGKSWGESLVSYHLAKAFQHRADERAANAHNLEISKPGIKVLIATQAYIAHDPMIGGDLISALRSQGVTPIFADRCPRGLARKQASALTSSLYWVTNKEVVGAVQLLRDKIDGVILLTAFPCGTDCLVNELLLRRVRGLPITQIILDGQHGQAGLETRVECFVDIIREARRKNAG